jgi:hypothetical protein
MDPSFKTRHVTLWCPLVKELADDGIPVTAGYERRSGPGGKE